MKKKLIVKLINKIPLEISISTNEKLFQYIDQDILDELNTQKNNIENDISQKRWDYSKKLCNKYDMIHICSNRIHNESNNISGYSPISRSYYKLWEILYIIKNNIPNDSINVATIAEGPGGFTECIINFRKINNPGIKDKIFGITLKSSDRDIPGWSKTNIFKDVNISYGADNTGNIYNYSNIIHFTQTVGKNSCSIVTADGGFDFSNDFNRQEQSIYRLLLCEIVTAISVQKKGGVFVCKFFDLHTTPTIKLYYLLNVLYEYTEIIKPKMSRPANSERYIVCVNFKGINDTYLTKLLYVIRYWDKIEKEEPIIDIFSTLYNITFFNLICKYNNYVAKKQTKYILKTFDIIKNDYNFKLLKQIQREYSINWCKKYNIPLNTNSKYI